MSVVGPDGYLNSQAGLTGPNSSYYASDPYGYSYSSESQDGHIYTHTMYTYGGASTDYHAASYHGSAASYAVESIYRAFPSSAQSYADGYAPPPYSASYGYETSIYETASLSDQTRGSYVDQQRSFSSYTTYSSGYSVSYTDTGSSEFHNGSFVAGSAVNYSLDVVTNPYGYSTYAPNLKTY